MHIFDLTCIAAKTKCVFIPQSCFCVSRKTIYILQLPSMIVWGKSRLTAWLQFVFCCLVPKGLTLKICVWCLCMYVLFYVCIGTGLVDWQEKRFIREKKTFFEVWICSWQSLIVLRLPWAIDRTLKSNYWLTSFCLMTSYDRCLVTLCDL